jgi:fatty-acyl-CoA synthase
MGEVGCAWIVADGCRPDPDELISYCAERLARFKVPSTVYFIEESQIPTTATGRVQKFALVELAVARAAASDGTKAHISIGGS